MAQDPLNNQWRTLDKDLGRISQLEYATQYVSRPMVGLGIALAFVVIVGIAVTIFLGTQTPSPIIKIGRASCRERV